MPDRRVVVLGSLAGLGLAACGFTPVYGPQGGGTRLQDAVEPDAPDGRAGYLLVRQLEDRLGRAASPRYGLSYSIHRSKAPSAISANNVITRYNLRGDVTYALRDLESGTVLSTGKVEHFTAFSASGSTVATESAERDAEARLMVILADGIVTRLMAAAPGLPA